MKARIILLFAITLLAAVVRLYNVSNNPPGLYIDEVSIGYNAATIVEAGKDEYGTPYPLYFKAYGEYKLPIYIYLTAISESILGRTDLAVRLPSAVAGISTVLLFYFLLERALFLEKRAKEKSDLHYLPYIGALILALTPWHIQFSRGGFEANVALFFFLCGVLFFLEFLQRRKIVLLIASIIVAGLSLYTYSTYRIITPLAVIIGIIYLIKYHILPLKKAMYISAVFVAICYPIFFFSATGAGQARFVQTAAFSEYEITGATKFLMYPLIFIKNYITYFSPAFLFSHGDGIGRHQMPGFGPLFRFELVFIIIGSISFLRKKLSLLSCLIIILLLLAPLPAALARPSPHTLRSMLLVIPLTILAAQGVVSLSKRRILLGLVLAIALFEGVLYGHSYLDHYSKVNALDWGGSYKALVTEAAKYAKQGTILLVDDNLGSAPIYFSFYSPTTKYEMINAGSEKFASLKKGSSVYIRPYYGDQNKPEIIETIYLPTVNHDVFAQFWKL